MHSSELFDENLTGKSGLLDQMISYAGVASSWAILLLSPMVAENQIFPMHSDELSISEHPELSIGMTLCKYKNIILIIF